MRRRRRGSSLNPRAGVTVQLSDPPVLPLKTYEASKTDSSASRSIVSSQALRWIWNYLQDVEDPRILDCGSVSVATVRVLMSRKAKIYVGDMLGPVQRSDPAYWRSQNDQMVFALDEFLALLPEIPPESLSLICCWHLLDLLPADVLPGLLSRLLGLLEKGGILYGFLREASLAEGKDGRWSLESLTTLGVEAESQGRFPYPAVSNREVENLTADYSLKTFLTRSHRREIVVLKKGDV